MLYMCIFFIVWGIEFAAGYYVSHIIGYVHTDAMSRVANAFYVLYSKDPHLGAIGFIWTPLPSFVELIFLLFYPLFPALASSGLAGIFMSSLFASCTAVLMIQAGDRFRLPRWSSTAISLLFILNPFMFLFGMNGLSDAPFIFFTMYAIVHVTYWLKNPYISHLVKVGFSLALAFWTRYEAVPFGMVLGLVLILVMIDQSKKRLSMEHTLKINKKVYYHIESTLIVTWLPVIFSGLLWIFLNWIIMGNPLYFLNSEYSNVEQSSMLATDPKFMELIGHPWNSLVYVIDKMSYFSIPLFTVIVLKLINRRWQVSEIIELIGLTCLVCSIAALQYLLLLQGNSYGWFRYFMYTFPIAVAWLPYEISKARPKMKPINIGIVFVSLILSQIVLGTALMDPEVAPDENKILHAHQYANLQDVDREVASYLDEQLKDAWILMDSYTAFYVILNSNNPKRYVITSDYNYQDALRDPDAHGIDFILTPKPNPSSALSAENRLYPRFYEQGTEWTELYKEFGEQHGGLWKLYRVKKKESVNDET